ncbi:MAG: hypothetical protein J5922_05210 [Clostridia bacterium]|nr:hypothetical protein [Clostridia bacterium]
MFLIKCINAYEAIGKLMDEKTDYKSAHALVCLRAKLKIHAEFFACEERALLCEFAKKDEKGNPIVDAAGNFEFEEGKDISDFYKRRDELCKTEAEIDDLPVSVKIPEKISPSAVEALLDFVSFKEEM